MPTINDVQDSPDLITVRFDGFVSEGGRDDGDTIQVYLPGDTKPTRIRLSNIDTPEVGHGSRQGEPLGNEAQQYARKFFEVPGDPGKYVDSIQIYWPGKLRDDNGRAVAFVFDASGQRMLNWEQVREGNSPYVSNPKFGGAGPWESDFARAAQDAVRDTTTGKETVWTPENLRAYIEKHGLQSFGNTDWQRKLIEMLPDGSQQVLTLPRVPEYQVPNPKAISKAGDAERYQNGGVKIGATWLSLPPENIQVKTDNEIVTHQLLRSPGNLAERTGFSQTMITLTGRLDIDQIRDSLQPILAQFTCCPFLPVRNIDLDRHLADKGVVYATTMAESEAGRKDLKDAIDGVQKIRQEIMDSVDTANSKMTPQEVSDLADAIAATVLTQVSTSKGLDEVLQEWRDNPDSKVGSTWTRIFSEGGFSISDDRWGIGIGENIQENIAFKGDAYGPNDLRRDLTDKTSTRVGRMAFIDRCLKLAQALQTARLSSQRATNFFDDQRMDEPWVALASFGATPTPGAPESLNFSMVLQVFNYLPYTSFIGFRDGSKVVDSPEDSVAFMSTWSRLITSGRYSEPLESMLPVYLRPSSETGLAWGSAQTVLSMVEAQENADSAPFPNVTASQAILPSAMSAMYTYAGDYVQQPIEGERYSTLQWLGSGTSAATLTFMTDDYAVIEKLKDIDASIARLSRRFEKQARRYYLTVQDPFLNTLGFHSCDISTLEITTAAPGEKGPVWSVRIQLQSITPKLAALHRTQRVRDPKHPNPYAEALKWLLAHPDSCALARSIISDYHVGTTPFKNAVQALRFRKPEMYDRLMTLNAQKLLDSIAYDLEKGQEEIFDRNRKNDPESTWSPDKPQMDPWLLSATMDELQKSVQLQARALDPALTRIINAVYGHYYELPTELKTILAGVSGQMSFGEFFTQNLYKDFPVGSINSYRGADGRPLLTPGTYWNPDDNCVDTETADCLVDPWHFLYISGYTSEEGGPSERSLSADAALYHEAVKDAMPAETEWQQKYRKATETWIDPARRGPDGGYAGDITAIDWTSKPDYNAVKKLSEELEYLKIADQMDFLNTGNILPNEKSFIRQTTERTLAAVAQRWRGIAGAFPTFWMVFLQKNAESWGMFDDFYSYQAITSFSILRNKNFPTDTAYVTVSNLYGNLGGPVAEQLSSGEEVVNAYTAGSEKQNRSLERGAFPLEPGTEVMIKMGYGNNINKLETVFTGQVAEISEGPVMELVLQGYGAELLEPFNPNASPKQIRCATAKELAEYVLMQPNIEHFGRNPDQGFWEHLFFGDMVANEPGNRGVTGMDELRGYARTADENWGGGNWPILSRKWNANSKNRTDFVRSKVADVNIWLPNLEPATLQACQSACRVYSPFILNGYCPWLVLEEIQMDHPGMMLGVRPYDTRSTVVMGMPNLDYYQSSRALMTANSRRSGTPGVPSVRKRPMRNYHIARSGLNLIKNELTITKEFNNQVFLAYDNKVEGAFKVTEHIPGVNMFKKAFSEVFGSAGPKPGSTYEGDGPDAEVNATSSLPSVVKPNVIQGGFDNETALGRHATGQLSGKMLLTFDSGIPKGQIKTYYAEKRNVVQEDQALRFASSILKNCVERAYMGSIWMRSDVDIWPGDVIMVFDDANQMFGAIEADEVILHFDREVGYCYEVKPNALTNFQNFSTPETLHSSLVYAREDGRIGTSGSAKEQGNNPNAYGSTNTPWSILDPFKNLFRASSILFDSNEEKAMASLTSGARNHPWFDFTAKSYYRYTEKTYTSLANHPFSVFPLMYQGRVWWPNSFAGNVIEEYNPELATPDASIAQQMKTVGLKTGLSKTWSILKGWAYSNASLQARQGGGQ